MTDIKIDLPPPSEANAKDVVTAIEGAINKLKDFKASVGGAAASKPDDIIREQRRPQSKVIPYGIRSYPAPGTTFRSHWNRPFHDLTEIARAVDTESYLARSIQKHREYALKEGWYLSGKNPETVAYVKKRLMEFEMISSVTTEEIIREVVTNLVSYSTALLVLNREPSKSTGRQIRLHGKTMNPISAIFGMDPTSVYVQQNTSGRALAWRQQADGMYTDFDADEVICITIDRKSGFIFGTPYVITVLDDIRALRRLEELVEMVSHKHLFPLFHYRVGTETSPAGQMETPDGILIDEIDYVRSQVNLMPTEGGIVTSERHQIQFLGAEGKVLDLEPYLKHFEARVMGGLRLSGIDLGRGDTANRSTAGVINKNLMEAVKDYQQVISDQLTSKLINLIVLEGGFDLTDENKVEFKFPAIDREELRAHVNFGLSLYNANAITLEEFRRDFLSMEPMSKSESAKQTNFGLYVIPKLEKEAELKMKMAGPAVPPQEKEVENKVRPENQYGKMSGKPRLNKNDNLVEDIKNMWLDTRQQVKQSEGLDNTEHLVNKFINDTFNYCKPFISIAVDNGSMDAIGRMNDATEVNVPAQLTDIFLSKIVKSDLQKISRKVIILLKQSSKDNATVTAAFDSVFLEMKHSISKFEEGAYRFGYAEACSIAGYDRILIKEGDKVVKTINLDGMSIRDVSSDCRDETYIDIDENSKVSR